MQLKGSLGGLKGYVHNLMRMCFYSALFTVLLSWRKVGHFSLSEFLLITLLSIILLTVYERLPLTLRPLGLAIPRSTLVQLFLIPVSVVIFGLITRSLITLNYSFTILCALSSIVVTCLALRPVQTVRQILRIFYQFLHGASIFRHRDEYSAYIWHSKGVRDFVSLDASRGNLDFSQLGDLLNGSETFNVQGKYGFLNNSDIELDPTWLMNLARLIALQPVEESDQNTAIKIYRLIWDSIGPRAFRTKSSQVTQQHSKVFLDLLLHVREYSEWQNVLANLKPLSKNKLITNIDKFHPKIQTDESGLATWQEAFNQEFKANNLESLAFEANGDSYIDSITCVPERFVDGPLVTVIVSAFNPGQELITSLKSICNQTWRHLEILVIDDASTEVKFIDLGRTLDPRIRVIRQHTNLGTYMARNLGMSQSRGEFIATHDSDDWMHPQRIERHVLPMIRSTGIKATISRGIRTTPDLVLSHLGFSPFRQNASSLTFRRNLIDEIGYFDTVRKGADSEFDARISSIYPSSIYLVGLEPLTIIRMGHDSLSRSEFKPNWVHPARQAYRSGYSRWHSKSKEMRQTPFLDPENPIRKFAAPERFTNSIEKQKYDLIYASSFTNQDERTIDEQYQELLKLIERGFKVGLLQIRPLPMISPLAPHLQDLLNSGSISLVIYDEQVETDVLLFRKLRPLQVKPFLPFSVIANRSFIVTTEESKTSLEMKKGNANSYLELYVNPEINFFDSELALNNLKDFGLTPKWIPTSEQQREEICRSGGEVASNFSTWEIEEFIAYLSNSRHRAQD